MKTNKSKIQKKPVKLREKDEVSGVEGRTGIKIHAGNNGDDTEGCLLPGTSGTYNSETGESTVSGSRNKLNELTDFLNKYGDSGITIQISA